MHVIPNNYYTLDASAGTVTLSTPYNNLNFEQFVSIVDLDTNNVIYDVHLKRDGVTYSGGVITYTTDNNITSDTDTIRIVVEDSAALTEALGGYNRTLDALKIFEQSPLDQQVLDPNPVLNAVTTAQSSTKIYTLDKKSITASITATGTTDGAILTIEGSNDGSNWGKLGTVDNIGNVENERTINENGTFFFEVVNAQRVKYMRATLDTVYDGTYTVYITGGAI